MKTKHISVRKGIATGLTGLLVVGALSALGAPAQAAGVADTDVDTIGGAFVWNVSDQVKARYGTLAPTGGAFVADAGAKAAGFPIESATASAGELTINYSGSVAFQANYGSVLYWTKIEDPTVTIDADGSGELSAVVSGWQHYEPAYPLEETTPTRVVVGEFASTTGNFDGESVEATIGAWSTDFVNQMASGTKPFYDYSAPTEYPSAFQLAQPTINAQVTTIAGDRVVEVQGENYFGGNADYKGVYVGLAPAGGQPSGGDSEDDGRKLYAGENYVPMVTNGAFTSFFDVKEENVTAGAPYSVYSWQAHKHTTRALDFERPVGVLTEQVAAATSTKLTAKGSALAATLTATVTPAAAGTVTFKEGSRTVGTAKVTNGTATLKLSRLTAGTKSYTAVFTPADAKAFKGSTAAAAKAVVAKATAKITLKVTKKATRKKTGKISVSVAGASVNATGKVKVVIKAPGKKKIVKRVTLKKGKKSVALTKAKKKGTYKVSVSYSGNKNLKRAKKKSVSFKVK